MEVIHLDQDILRLVVIHPLQVVCHNLEPTLHPAVCLSPEECHRWLPLLQDSHMPHSLIQLSQVTHLRQEVQDIPLPEVCRCLDSHHTQLVEQLHILSLEDRLLTQEVHQHQVELRTLQAELLVPLLILLLVELHLTHLVEQHLIQLEVVLPKPQLLLHMLQVALLVLHTLQEGLELQALHHQLHTNNAHLTALQHLVNLKVSAARL